MVIIPALVTCVPHKLKKVDYFQLITGTGCKVSEMWVPYNHLVCSGISISIAIIKNYWVVLVFYQTPSMC